MTVHPRLAVAVLASFLAGGIVPQAPLVAHDHAGADAPHVHLAPLVPHRHGSGPLHVDADAGAGARLTLPHHVHTQHPFQHVDRPTIPAPVPAARAVAGPAPAPRAPADRPATTARSRGPPSHLVA